MGTESRLHSACFLRMATSSVADRFFFRSKYFSWGLHRHRTEYRATLTHTDTHYIHTYTEEPLTHSLTHALTCGFFPSAFHVGFSRCTAALSNALTMASMLS
jgi:hypothetical protein